MDHFLEIAQRPFQGKKKNYFQGKQKKKIFQGKARSPSQQPLTVRIKYSQLTNLMC